MSSSNSPTVLHHRASDHAKLDIHVLHFKEPESDLQRCLDSVDGIDGVNVTVVRGGFIGHIGAARRFAFGLGTSKYASFIDPDDWVSDPAHVVACIDEMESDDSLAGVYTDYTAVDKSGRRVFTTSKPDWTPAQMLINPFEVLHLKLYRRAAIQKHLDKLLQCPTYEEIAINNLACEYGTWQKIHVNGYCKRDGGQSMRLASDDLLRKVVKMSAHHVMKWNRPKKPIPSERELMRKFVPCSNCLGM